MTNTLVEITLFIPLILLLNALATSAGGEIINMKIVEEPSNYGFNNFNMGNAHQDENRLKMRVKPSNFSGPLHLKRLYKKCFTKVIDSYKYEFCPFFNLTQHEQSFRWNPYQGVLGVWQEWEIVNNTFVAMLMREGDGCGQFFRSVRCGKENEILNVTEFKTCQYQLVFSTPHSCPPHAMLVYPTLSSQLRGQWDILEGRYQRLEITTKGYNKQLRKIFEKSGYCLSAEKLTQIAQKAVEKELQGEKEEKGEFESLSQCTQEYKKLQKEIEGLRALLALKDDSVAVGHLQDTDSKANHHAPDSKANHHAPDGKANHAPTNQHVPDNQQVLQTDLKQIMDAKNGVLENTKQTSQKVQNNIDTKTEMSVQNNA